MKGFPCTVFSENVTETERIGKRFGEALLAHGRADAFLAIDGDLGAGKTAFVRGFAEAVTPGAPVCSPTYTLVNEYRGGGRRLCHFDFYRVESEEDLLSIGFYDYTDGMIAAEWCEKIEEALPLPRFVLKIEKLGEESRRLTFEYLPAEGEEEEPW